MTEQLKNTEMAKPPNMPSTANNPTISWENNPKDVAIPAQHLERGPDEWRKPVTGGCLCGSVRYAIKFPEGTKFPSENSNTCQCTSCRKVSGSLIAGTINMLAEQIFWGEPCKTFVEYESSKGNFRGFCNNCGSSISFRSAEMPRYFDVFIGTLDEDFIREGGKELCCAPGGQLYCKNFVDGVTDGIQSPGPKFVESFDGGRLP